MSRPIAIRVGILCLVSLGVGVGVAFGLRPSLPFGGEPRPEDDRVSRAIDAQLEQARALGLAEAREGESGRAELTVRGQETQRSFPIELARGECMAFVAASAGCFDVLQVVLRQGRLRLAAAAETGGASSQVRWCAWNAPSRVMVDVTLRGGRAEELGLPGRHTSEHVWCTDAEEARRAVLRWEVRRGPAAPIAGTQGLAAGMYVESGARAVADRDAADAWLQAHPGEGEPLGGPRESSLEHGAQLLPRSPVTCQALYQLANAGAATLEHPRVAPPDPGSPDEGVACPLSGAAPAAPILPPTYRPFTSRRDRILAVVDRGALGAPCVEVTIARMLRGRHVAPPVALVLDERGAPLREEVLRERGESFVHVDGACPAEGLVAYLAPGNDPAVYRLQARALPAPLGAVARPITTIRAPFPGGASTVLTGFQNACEAGLSPEACLRAADAYRDGADVAQDLARAAGLYRRACELGSMPGCAMLGHAYDVGEGVEPSPAEASRYHQRACDGGELRSCAYLGDAERLSAGATEEAMERARQHYTRACEGGIESACANAAALESQGLLRSVEEAPAPSPDAPGGEPSDPPLEGSHEPAAGP